MSEAKLSFYAQRAVVEEALAMDATNPCQRKAHGRIAKLYWQRAADQNLDLCAPVLSIVHTSVNGGIKAHLLSPVG